MTQTIVWILRAKGGKLIKGFDVLKVVMGFVVVSIHAEIADGFSNETLRQLGYAVNSLAVPVFFVISSFLFFSRYRSVVRGGQGFDLQRIINFERRINLL